MHFSLATSRTPLFYFDPNEETSVCFNPDSGDTHLLSTLAAVALSELGDETLSVADLTQILKSRFDAASAGEIETYAPTLMEELSNLGLVKIHE
ncbi:HPr-rel-A system PqqD family peptide chaperone [Chromatocurvus halotolerans]|uniref:PqqD family protein of HPr-rel-A system n=1 Tax=Chromatocurvus halotolerans TaxID=1132028 RepID=A0A4R2KRC6_9GAMM|nr:HPr-rel-A system PqqD family peptide chaperone [Chromatocurvus halotolerans]TCO76313.1 PqqD family protein of HPr-rel-A system [Chromatocurvus halotolerans]